MAIDKQRKETKLVAIIKRGLTPRQPAAVQGGTPKGNVALRQRQRQPPLDNQLGVFLCLQISHRLNRIGTF